MFDQLKRIDQEILLFFNSHHNSYLDSIMWFASDKITWIPLCVLISIVLILKFRKSAWLMFFMIIPLIITSDMVTSEIIKPLIGRWRPSHQPGLENLLHYVKNYRGGLYSFPSSHASSSFALVIYLSLITVKKIRWFPYLLIPVAVLISYSRMYLGVHYPSDVLCGAIFGAFLGWIFSRFYFFLNHYLKKTKVSNG